MKRIIAAIIFSVLAASASASATSSAPLSFNFSAIPVNTFLHATYKTLLARDFVISPEVLALDKRVTISVKSVPADSVPAFVDEVLRSQGIRAVLRDGIYYVDLIPLDAHGVSPVVEKGGEKGVRAPVDGAAPVAPGANDLYWVYEPENRPAEFMVTVLNAAFGSSVARQAGTQVVLVAPKDRIDDVLELCQLLDVALRTVEVSASFIEVSRSSNESHGLSLVASVLGAKFGTVVGSGSGSFTITASNFQLVLDALAADGRFKQVSNSRVLGDETERMTLTVGDETPTIASTGRDNQGNGVQNVVYRPSGVIVDVTPRVLGSRRISLVVDGQVSSFQSTLTGVTGSPTLVKRQVKTSVTVGDGEVVVIGGLDDTKSSGQSSGFSFLPKSLRGSSNSDSHTDLVLILSAKASR